MSNCIWVKATAEEEATKRALVMAQTRGYSGIKKVAHNKGVYQFDLIK